MPAPKRWLHEPLVHFIVAGAILFAAYSLLHGDAVPGYDDTMIHVERRELLTFLQYRANAFEPETFGAALDAMTDRELQEIIDAYIDEEILYREARQLGLEESDNIIRQRMVQKMNFLLSDVAAAGRTTDEDGLAAYFEANRDAYAIQPWATFTHVFFDVTRRGEDGALAAAEAALLELNAAGAGFNDATEIGDRFPFLRNYVERTFEYIANHFGYEFTERLAVLEPSSARWQGPFRSVYGQHIVMLTRREERQYPSLEGVRADVERDFANEQANAALGEMLETIRERYRVEVGQIRSSPSTTPSRSPNPTPSQTPSQ
jgi:peptidyl-prolyl cis-trans isomerase C